MSAREVYHVNPIEDRFPRLWGSLDRISVLVIGSLLFWLFSALLITLPAAFVGLLASVSAFVRPVSGETLGRFWNGFRRTFGRALLLGLLNLVLGIILYVDIRFFWSRGTLVGQVIAFSFAVLAFLLLLVNVYAWPLLTWFPQPLGKLLKRSALLAAAHPIAPIVAVLGSLLLLLVLALLPPPFNGLIMILGPGSLAALMGLCAWSTMKRYADPDDEFAE